MSRAATSNNPRREPTPTDWMRRAVEIARDTQPHPNPRVGAVVVSSEGVLLGDASHPGPPEAHAEAAALSAAGAAARGATLYVTLEPCNHEGRTPPCTEAIIEAGVARVVVGTADPDQRVTGGGIERLRVAGIDVIAGEHSDLAVDLDPGYFHHRRTGRPRVTLKLAATLDGQTAAADGTSQWITSEEARADAHALRARADAVMVGAGTLRSDDPKLDARAGVIGHHQPRPVVVAGRRPLPDAARVYARRPLVYAPRAVGDLPDGVEVKVLWDSSGVELEAMMKDLGARGVVDLLVEGGATLARSLLDAELVDHLVIYLAAMLAGGVGKPMFAGDFRTLAAGRGLDVLSVRRLGSDLRVDASPSGVAP